MAFEEQKQRQPTRQELEDTAKAEKEMADAIERASKEWSELSKNPDKILTMGRNMADWLQRELDNLQAFGTNQSLEVMSIIRDHAFGDVTLKAFQLVTLKSLTTLYESNSRFQWFINSSSKTLAMVAVQNPMVLHYDFFNPGVVGPVDRPGHPETLTRLSTNEKVVLETINPTPAGFYYLWRRPWLCNYITALMFYRHFHSFEWINKAIAEMTLKGVGLPNQGPEKGAPNPDSVSTDIPFPVLNKLPN